MSPVSAVANTPEEIPERNAADLKDRKTGSDTVRCDSDGYQAITLQN